MCRYSPRLQIFSHLEPIDLLHLARTNKSFRALLVSRRSTALWRAARRNIPDLPECPEDISEPALANLLFLSNCHVRRRLDMRQPVPG